MGHDSLRRRLLDDILEAAMKLEMGEHYKQSGRTTKRESHGSRESRGLPPIGSRASRGLPPLVYKQSEDPKRRRKSELRRKRREAGLEGTGRVYTTKPSGDPKRDRRNELRRARGKADRAGIKRPARVYTITPSGDPKRDRRNARRRERYASGVPRERR